MCGGTWEDIIAFFNQNNNEIENVEYAAGSPQSDVGQPSMDPVDHPIESEEVERHEFSRKSVVFVTLLIFDALLCYYFKTYVVTLHRLSLCVRPCCQMQTY